MTNEQCERKSGGNALETLLIGEFATETVNFSNAGLATGSIENVNSTVVAVGSTHLNRSTPAEAGQPG